MPSTATIHTLENGLTVIVEPPDEVDETAFRTSAVRAARTAYIEAKQDRDHEAGWTTSLDGERVLAIKGNAHCCRGHEPEWQKSSCGHHYCGICAGYVDPATLVVMGKPRATVWCNRRPMALDTY